MAALGLIRDIWKGVGSWGQVTSTVTSLPVTWAQDTPWWGVPRDSAREEEPQGFGSWLQEHPLEASPTPKEPWRQRVRAGCRLDPLWPQPPRQVRAVCDTSPDTSSGRTAGPSPTPQATALQISSCLRQSLPAPLGTHRSHTGWVEPPCSTTASPWGSPSPPQHLLQLAPSTSPVPFTLLGAQGCSCSAGNVLTTSGEPQRAPEHHQMMLTWVPTRSPDLGTSPGPNTSPGTDMCQKPQRSQPAQDAPRNFPCVCCIMYLGANPKPCRDPKLLPSIYHPDKPSLQLIQGAPSVSPQHRACHCTGPCRQGGTSPSTGIRGQPVATHKKPYRKV